MDNHAIDPRTQAPRRVPLPPVLTLGGSLPLVARARSWSLLADTWAAASTGARHIVLIPGEAGTGKTRLVSEFARSVHGEGATVLYGACSEQQSVPYQPFAEALEHLVSAFEPGELEAALGPDSGELARLVPARADDLGAPTPEAGGMGGDPNAARYRLFGAVTAVLANLARERPVFVALDDLHWAREPSVDLLAHIVRHASLSRLCIVGTYRSATAEVGAPFKAILPELWRQPGVARLPLAGLDPAGVHEFVEAAAGHPVHPELRPVVDVLTTQTDGNPFLLIELWRHLVESGQLRREGDRWGLARPLVDIASPEGVREVVDARLARLDESVRQLLGVAAVIGTSFDPAVLAVAARSELRSVLETLEPALRASIVEESAAGDYPFGHALIRRSVYDSLGVAERRGHHLAVASALDQVHGERSVAEIAHHTVAAVPLADTDEVVTTAKRAARAAMAAVAYQDAVRHLEAVLGFAAGGRGEILLEVADAQKRSGDVAGALERCLEAAGCVHHTCRDRQASAISL